MTHLKYFRTTIIEVKEFQRQSFSITSTNNCHVISMIHPKSAMMLSLINITVRITTAKSTGGETTSNIIEMHIKAFTLESWADNKMFAYVLFKKVTRAKGTKSLRRNVLSILSFKAIWKSWKKQNANENNAEQKNTNQTHFKC